MKIYKEFNVNETMSWIASRSSPHNCIAVALIEGSIDKNIFMKALNFVFINNEILSLTVSPSICGFIKCNKTLKVRFDISCDSWQKIAEQELKTPFNEGEVLLRVSTVLIGSLTYLIFCFHHIICDGKSIIQFIIDLIKYYNNPFSYVGSERISLLASIGSPIAKNFPIPILGKNVTKIMSITISEDESRKIVRHAKMKSLSFTSIISSLIISAYFKSFVVNKLNINLPIDIRNTNDKDYRLSFIASWVNFPIGKQDDNHLLANIFERKLKSSMSDMQHFNNIAKLSDMIDSRKNDSEFLGRFISQTPSLGISNSGNWHVEYNGSYVNKINLRSINLAVNSQAYMGRKSFTVAIANVNRNNLTLNICYPYPIVSDKEIINFITYFHENMLIK